MKKFSVIVFMAILSVLPAKASAQSLGKDHRIELRAGWETQRKSPVGLFGYAVPIGEQLFLVPEMQFIVGFTPCLSVRYMILKETTLIPYGQLGLGFTTINDPLTTFVAAFGVQHDINTSLSISLEGRALIFNNQAKDINVGGVLSSSEPKDLKEVPPVAILIGISYKIGD